MSVFNEDTRVKIPATIQFLRLGYHYQSLKADDIDVDEAKNGIASVTFILEHYIIKTIKKIFRGTISSEVPIEIWKDTKKVAKWMYINGTKEIDERNLELTVKKSEVFIQVMMQAGFLEVGEYKEDRYYFFAIDTLTDFLIARSLYEDIAGKTIEKQIETISEKVKNLYSIQEAVVIAIFDNYAPNYQYIMELLKETDLLTSLQYKTLVKIRFNKEYIEDFLQVFHPLEHNRLISIFGGYADKPFNCTNYLNFYYKSNDRQLRELSIALSGSHINDNVKGRLKNIIYFITINNNSERRLEEAFYFALLCCAAPNRDVRCLALKLLYEIVIRDEGYKNRLIAEYNNIIDPYIREGIIYVLSNYLQDNEEVIDFFTKLINGNDKLTAKSIKRISTYIKDKYGYIKWDRENLYNVHSGTTISDFMNAVLFRVDIMNKDFMPFRYWSKNRIDMFTKFLDVDKKEIYKLNCYLEEKYKCVKIGECNGSMSFEKYIIKECGVDLRNRVLKMEEFFCSFEAVLKQVFNLFQEPTDEIDRYKRTEDFADSIFMKCVDISTGYYYGSLMCNYYTDEFATYNNWQDSIGYEVYDPIEYGENINITAPIPTYQSFIEELGDKIVDGIEVPERRDILWAKDTAVTRKNLLSLIEPIKVKEIEWIMLAGRVSVHGEGDTKSETEWRDTYDIWCCTSEKETILDDGNARYLTIELDEYVGNLDDYKNCVLRPWLCKDVSNIDSRSDVFDDTSLVLPPAELVSYFQLRPVYSDMSWVNPENRIVILCNNNKSSYYKDPIGGTVFIRKNYLDEYLKEHTLKYFAFTERYIPETGYADETSLHFEIRGGKIIKEFLNYGEKDYYLTEVNAICENCPYGLSEKIAESRGDLKEWIEGVLENRYSLHEENKEN